MRESSAKASHIVLVGFMGTGKTTVGAILAEFIGWTMIDSDAYVIKKERKTIPEIFAQSGEAYFRQAEKVAIREILSGESYVVATGGGSVLAEENRRIMRDRGFVVALTAPLSVIVERVRSDKNRPLLHGDLEQRVQVLLSERESAYNFAHLQMDTTQYSPEAIAGIIWDAYNKHNAALSRG
ncbi:hypothetical protein SY83_15395 [Paenibacillus swuensis]|uniref:Shikimate kinase n=1 Tax=Paenibacillus swuensis TaxID=1178515 RepID=A0A172TK57_9BACL|nr:shikimate kinase [Paenibacillus swuensis]ANE47431.1 hypothetical protein SY83_15395 [Paenibacillus swuensis]